MRFTISAVFLFAFSFAAPTSPSSAADNACDSVLRGAHNVRVVDSEEQYVQDTIRWARSQKFSSEQSARQAAGTFGISLPVEGVPVDFKGAFSRGEFGAKSWGEAFADYLSTHEDARKNYYEMVRERDPASIKAWSDCIGTISSSPGLYCWTYQSDDPNQVDLFVKFVPKSGEMNMATISSVEPGNLRPTVNLVGEHVFLQEKRFVAVREDKGPGAIEIASGDTRCVARVGALATPEAPKLPEPCMATNSAGTCDLCRFPLARETDSGRAFLRKRVGEQASYNCEHLPPNSKVRVRLSGPINIDGAGPPWWYQLKLGLLGCDGDRQTVIESSKVSAPSPGGLAMPINGKLEAVASALGTCRADIRYDLEDTNEPASINGRTLSAQGEAFLEIVVVP